MTIRTSKQAMAASLGQTRNVPGQCQKVMRGWFNAPSAGDQDHDGDADAQDGWLSEPKSARHPGDRNPPPGKPLRFSKNGGKGFGHSALSLVRGIRSTDMSNNRYKAGITSTVTASSTSAAIAIIENAMGVDYLGWSDTVDGIPIPPEPKPPAPKPVKPVSKSLFRVRIGTENLMSLPKNKFISKTIKAVQSCQIVGFQEANLVSFKQTLKKRYPAIIGLGPIANNTYSTPLMINANVFRHLKTGTAVMHPGAAGISFTRRLTWAIVQHKVSKAEIGVINLHAVLVKSDAKREQRLLFRGRDKNALKLQVDTMQKQGLPIIVTGDFNDKTNWLGAKFGGQRVQRVAHGIDQILLVDSATHAWVIDAHSTSNTPSDHDALRALVDLVAR